MSLAEEKAAARVAALARREAAHAAAGPDEARLLTEVLARHRGRPVAGYVAMRAEIDPLPALAEAARSGPVGLPVIERKAAPLRFREWRPGVPMIPGTFGAAIPAEGEWMIPEVLIVPLVAFDRQGGRLGYGGGFYDRTLAELKRLGPVTAIGFAYAAQEAARLPVEATDVPLDLIVTEAEVIAVQPSASGR